MPLPNPLPVMHDDARLRGRGAHLPAWSIVLRVRVRGHLRMELRSLPGCIRRKGAAWAHVARLVAQDPAQGHRGPSMKHRTQALRGLEEETRKARERFEQEARQHPAIWQAYQHHLGDRSAFDPGPKSKSGSNKLPSSCGSGRTTFVSRPTSSTLFRGRAGPGSSPKTIRRRPAAKRGSVLEARTRARVLRSSGERSSLRVGRLPSLERQPDRDRAHEPSLRSHELARSCRSRARACVA